MRFGDFRLSFYDFKFLTNQTKTKARKNQNLQPTRGRRKKAAVKKLQARVQRRDVHYVCSHFVTHRHRLTLIHFANLLRPCFPALSRSIQSNFPALTMSDSFLRRLIELFRCCCKEQKEQNEQGKDKRNGSVIAYFRLYSNTGSFFQLVRSPKKSSPRRPCAWTSTPTSSRSTPTGRRWARSRCSWREGTRARRCGACSAGRITRIGISSRRRERTEIIKVSN